MSAERRPTVGLALIARDEEKTLPGLLSSVSGCFDQVALVDTGSSDQTATLFERWAAGESDLYPHFRGDLKRWRWREDFAAARNVADSMLQTDWLAWADADDEIHGARHLRRVIASVPGEIAALIAGYRTSAHTFSGGTLGFSQRVRLVRAGLGRWRDPVHEELIVTGWLGAIAHTCTLWVHRKSEKGEMPNPGRNLEILRRWLEREPENPRGLHYAGREEAAFGRHSVALPYYERFFAVCTRLDELAAQVHRCYAISLMKVGRFAEAEQDARAVIAAFPEWPDSYLTLAEVELERDNPSGVIENANRVIELGPPRTTLPYLVTDYTTYPRVLIARALQRSGEWDAAHDAAAQALSTIESD
jgi:tetratricopeptide (TPR) repeat protein